MDKNNRKINRRREGGSRFLRTTVSASTSGDRASFIDSKPDNKFTGWEGGVGKGDYRLYFSYLQWLKI